MGKSNHPLGQRIVIARLCYVEGVMGLKMCMDTDQDGTSISTKWSFSSPISLLTEHSLVLLLLVHACVHVCIVIKAEIVRNQFFGNDFVHHTQGVGL